MSSQKDRYLSTRNEMLSRLPRPDYERLRPRLELVRLPRGRVVYGAGDTLRHIYFITGGMVSLLATTLDGHTVEVAMVGSEGAVGALSLLRINVVPYQVEAQLPVTALRLSLAAPAAECERGGHLHDLLLRYLHTLFTQITQSALCNRYHTIEQRLCRWLLVGRDRALTDHLALTQASLAHMIGSQRTGVTAAAAALQRRGLINYRRGKIKLLDGPGLEARSCECYGVTAREIEQYLAP
ncbi:MAG TPA: Crp/Fnr family transcriptional regulator [Pyrinomonadaceae bacterium]|jgi:CRP-like cAMP-binding protein